MKRPRIKQGQISFGEYARRAEVSATEIVLLRTSDQRLSLREIKVDLMQISRQRNRKFPFVDDPGNAKIRAVRHLIKQASAKQTVFMVRTALAVFAGVILSFPECFAQT